MPNRSSKSNQDVNEIAFGIVSQLEGKNPAAVALGRLGGLKGGHARAKKLSKSKRHKIAVKAAKARWKRNSHASHEVS